MDTFGSRVRSARDSKGWTQERLAKESGAYSGVVVSRWENGHGKPHDPDVVVKLADVLGVSIDWLLRGIGAGPSAASAQDTAPAGTFPPVVATQTPDEIDREAVLDDAPSDAA